MILGAAGAGSELRSNQARIQPRAVCNCVYGGGAASCLLAHVSWSDGATNRAIKQIAPHRTRNCKPP